MQEQAGRTQALPAKGGYTQDAKKHGHPGNQFHTVEQAGFSTSFYISGEELATLTAYLEQQGKSTDKVSLGKQARLWFHEMMEQKKNEFSKSSQKSSEKA